MPFYGDGVYAAFFRGQAQTRKQSAKLLYAYDLEALDSDETLKVLMSMCVIQEIMTMMSKPESLKRGGVLYIEELGCLGRDRFTARTQRGRLAGRSLGFFPLRGAGAIC